MKLLKIFFSLIFGFIIGADVIMIFYTFANIGSPHNSGDLAGFVITLYLAPFLSIPVAFILNLVLSNDSAKFYFLKATSIVFTSTALAFLLDWILRRNF